MIRGLYTAASGMLAAQAQGEIVGDNIANIKTPGFKQELGSNQAFPDVLLERINDGAALPEQTAIGGMSTGVIVDRTARLTVQGGLETTDLPTDLALLSQGDTLAFFSVQTPSGVMYTRNGSFHLNSAGELQTGEGYAVLGENGPIGPLDSDFKVQSDGTILNGQGELVDRLQMVNIESNRLERRGSSLYTADQVMVADNVEVRQGTLEGSNVDLNSQIVQMMTVMRAYEANQKVIQAQDATLEKATNEIGKVQG